MLYRQMEVWDDDYEPPHECQPTLARPGSKEKIAVMQARVEAHQKLHHADDEKLLAPLYYCGDHCERRKGRTGNARQYEIVRRRGAFVAISVGVTAS